MAIDTLPPRGLFRTAVLRSPVQRVDRDAKVLRGVKLIQLGKVNDSRNWVVDEETLEQVEQFATQSNRGPKVRFTHPDMSNDGLGKHLGRIPPETIRRDGDALVGDLHLADSAFDTPNGDLATYVMDLAEEDPEAFGMSIATELAESMFAESEAEDSGEPTPLRITRLRAADVVDEPAATRGGMFDMSQPEGLPALAAWVLEHHFKGAARQVIEQRFSNFLDNHFGGHPMSTSAPAPAADPKPAPQPEPVNFRDEARPYIDAFGDRGAKWFLEGKDLLSCYQAELSEVRQQLAAMTEERDSLQEQLASMPLGEDEPLSSSPAPDKSKPTGKAVFQSMFTPPGRAGSRN